MINIWLSPSQQPDGTQPSNYMLNKVPVITGMSRARNSRWGMLLYMNEVGTDYIYGGQNKIGVHGDVYHVSIAIHAW